MVRVNLLDPRSLSDQHLIAEYNEILMLMAYIRKHPKVEGVPDSYCLGPGHMKFFKNKVGYLKNRHKILKEEMKARSFQANKSLDLGKLERDNMRNWEPSKKDFDLIRSRIIEKLNLKPKYYRYLGEYRDKDFFISLLTKKYFNAK